MGMLRGMPFCKEGKSGQKKKIVYNRASAFLSCKQMCESGFKLDVIITEWHLYMLRKKNFDTTPHNTTPVTPHNRAGFISTTTHYFKERKKGYRS
jgi:hypothetical protein